MKDYKFTVKFTTPLKNYGYGEKELMEYLDCEKIKYTGPKKKEYYDINIDGIKVELKSSKTNKSLPFMRISKDLWPDIIKLFCHKTNKLNSFVLNFNEIENAETLKVVNRIVEKSFMIKFKCTKTELTKHQIGYIHTNGVKFISVKTFIKNNFKNMYIKGTELYVSKY